MKIWKVALCLLLCLPLSGCWDYQRVNDRAQVTGIAVDPDPDNPHHVLFTLHVPVFSEGAESTDKMMGAGSAKHYKNFMMSCTTLSTALAKLQTRDSKEFYLANLQAIILNDHLPAKQIEHVVGSVMGNMSSDKLAYVYLTHEQAGQFLGAASLTDPVDDLQNVFSRVRQVGYTVRRRIWEFWRDTAQPGINPMTSMLSSDPDGLDVGGAAVFRGFQPVWELSKDEAADYNIIMGKMKNMAMTFPYGDSDFELIHLASRSKGYVRRVHGRLELVDNIVLKGDLDVNATNGEVALSPQDMQLYEKSVEKIMEYHVVQFIRECQKRKVDPFGFGLKDMVIHPKDEPTSSDNWADLFSSAAVNVHVQVQIGHKGALN